MSELSQGVFNAMKESKNDERRQICARIDPDAYEWLRRQAFSNYRTVNSELNHILTGLVRNEPNAAVEGASQG